MSSFTHSSFRPLLGFFAGGYTIATLILASMARGWRLGVQPLAFSCLTRGPVTLLILVLIAAMPPSASRCYGQIAAQWVLAGNANDALGLSNGTATNMQWVNAPDARGNLRQMAYFDGTGSISIAPNSLLYMPSTGFSITAWVRADSFAGTGNNNHFKVLDAAGIPNVSESAFDFGFSSNNLRFTVSGANDYPVLSATGWVKWYQTGINGTDPASANTSHIMDPNNWYFLGLSFDGAFAHSYLNGVEMTNAAAANFPLNGVAPYQFTTPLLLGASHGGDPKMNGYMYDVTLYNAPLSSDQMASIAAIPEPSTYAAGIGLLSLIGVALGRIARRLGPSRGSLAELV